MARKSANKDQPAPVDLPAHEKTANRANAKRIASGQNPVPPVLPTVKRPRRAGALKSYSNYQPPTQVERREPVAQIPVARLPGQEDIPSSDDDPFASEHASRSANIHGEAILGLDSETEQLREDANAPINTSLNNPLHSHDMIPGEPMPDHPFGASQTFPAAESRQPDSISPEDSHLLRLPNSNLDTIDYGSVDWNNFDMASLPNESQFNQWMPNPPSVSQPPSTNPVLAGGSSYFPMPQPQTLGSANTSLLSGIPSATPISFVSEQPAPFEPLNSHSSTVSIAGSSSMQPNTPRPLASHSVPSAYAEPAIRNYTEQPASSNSGPTAPTRRSEAIHEPTTTPARNSTITSRTHSRINNSHKKVSSKTPQKKYIKANIAAHYAVQRSRRSRNPRKQPEDSENVAAEGESLVPASSTTLASSAGLTPDQITVSLPMRKFIGFHLLTRAPWPIDQHPLIASAIKYALGVPGNEHIQSVEIDPEFLRQLKLKQSSLRGEFANLLMSSVKEFYEISPSTQSRIDSLIRDDRFLFEDETIKSRRDHGFFSCRLLFRAVGMLLFEHPHNFGTIFMEQLCAEDPVKKWHAKAADRTATNGAPVGLIAFAGVAILHCLECIRDRPVTGKKAYKFEQARYSHIWNRYRTELIKYRHLGALRRKYLSFVKERYNEMNRISTLDIDDSDVDDDGDNNGGMSSDYASDEPGAGPQFDGVEDECDDVHLSD